MRTSLSARNATLGLYLAAALSLTAARPAPPPAPPPAAAPTTPAAVTPAAQVVGRGWLERAACLTCAGVILGAGGASVAGLVLLAAAAPEAVGSCGAVCVLAFG